MVQQEETGGEGSSKQAEKKPGKQPITSKRVTDHLANERTFLAWMRTGLATITFGFVVERFGLVLRELGLKNAPMPLTDVHYSSVIGIALTVLGVVIIIVALINFLQIRTAIDKETFHPQMAFAIVLTVLASLIGVLLVFYLWISA